MHARLNQDRAPDPAAVVDRDEIVQRSRLRSISRVGDIRMRNPITDHMHVAIDDRGVAALRAPPMSTWR